MHAQANVPVLVRRMLAVAWIAAAFSVTAYAQAGKSLVINHFVSDPQVIEGHLVVADVAGTGGSVNIAFYDEQGALAGKGAETIPANGKINVNPEKYVGGRKMVGTIRITSTQLISGQYWQFYKDSKLGWKNISVPASVAPGATKLICQHFVSDQNIESYMVVADGAGKATTVYVELYSDDGDLAGQTRVSIPANGKVSIQPFELVGRKKMTGIAYIQTEGTLITGEYWQVSAKEKYQVAHAMQGGAPQAADLADESKMRIMVNFDFDSDKIQKRSHADLLEVAKAMNASENKNAKYEVGGFTDDKGKQDYNVKLSERRATAVKNFLVKTGKVNAKRLTVKGYGPANPIVPNDSEANRARNRRVEFKKM